MKAAIMLIFIVLTPWSHVSCQEMRNCTNLILVPNSVYLIDSIFIDTLYTSYVFDGKRRRLELMEFSMGVASTKLIPKPISIKQFISSDDYYVLTGKLNLSLILSPVFGQYYKKCVTQEDSCKLEFYFRIHEMQNTNPTIKYYDSAKNKFILNHNYYVFLIKADHLFIPTSENDGYNGFNRISNSYLKVLIPITDKL